jgi:membrane-associated phospholipid phosphatase
MSKRAAFNDRDYRVSELVTTRRTAIPWQGSGQVKKKSHLLMAAYLVDNALLIVAFAVVAAAWLHRARRGLFVPFVLGAIAASALDLIVGHLWFELRPFAALHVAPCVPYDPADNSFPSDHAAAGAYVTTFLAFVDVRWAVVALVGTVVVSVARVACLLHYPHDIAAGWAIGAIPGTIAGYYAVRPAMRKGQS